jgi:hypothetical protein
MGKSMRAVAVGAAALAVAGCAGGRLAARERGALGGAVLGAGTGADAIQGATRVAPGPPPPPASVGTLTVDPRAPGWSLYLSRRDFR